MLIGLRRRFVPLRVRLPLLVVVLLAACTTGVIVVSYRAVRLSTASAAMNQLRSAADHIAGAFVPSLRNSIADARAVGQRPAIARWLATGANAGAATAALDSSHHVNANTAARIERRGGGQIAMGDGPLVDAARSAWSGTGVSPFFTYHDSVAFAVRVPLLVAGDTVGRIVVAQVMRDTAAQGSLIGGLIGRDATFLIGNADGSVWTNMATRVPAPVSSATLARLLAPNRRPGGAGDTLAAAELIPGSPWVVWIGQPTTIALAAATSLMWRLAALALLVILAGGVVAWMILRQFTKPIDDLAQAAEQLARGEYQPRAVRTGGDEVGRLTASFHEMAGQISQHQQELEDQVNERTVALEKALFDLQLAQEENVKRERLAVLGQLAGGVGHELRNPLGVMTNAVFVLESVLTDPNQIVRDYLGILRGQIGLSEKIISDLLDFARTKPAARMPTTAEAIVRAQLARMDPPKNVAIDLDVPASLPPVHVDPVQIGQVVFNLVMNGVQAMTESGGTLRCSARHDGNGSVRLDVTDSGPGIPPDVAARIFEPLFTTKVKGLGLGLTVSRMLAENNGGYLTFESTVGAGTTFTLTLPVAA
ncbi:MAG TPA: ATP-binding protein [Gemmatimonadaceae bacterium]|nr:ATP-binding protein [Gemmatimonadaceae bacterium]